MGCAYQAYPSMHTVHNMHRICQAAGVDVLLGGHPHNPQPMEVYTTTHPHTGHARQHFICYSQGDFVAYDIFKWCHLPLLLKLHITQGTLHGKKTTLITRVEAKHYYMYQNARKQLRLLDFEQVCAEPELHIAETTIRREVAELKQFWDLIHQPALQAQGQK
jgi:poly-gamma-glutamate synthesis protein (capsule biosynthesis protein)